MNEITLHGNLTAEPVLRRATTGRAATSFSIAVNTGYYDRTRGVYVNQPAVYHQVVCFGDLAENAAATLRKGTPVTVTGAFADDSYSPNGADRPIRRIRLIAEDVAVSLRWATATVTRRTRGEEPPEPATATPKAAQDLAGDTSEEPATQAA
jgi:single-strand DNA-binding protein